MPAFDLESALRQLQTDEPRGVNGSPLDLAHARPEAYEAALFMCAAQHFHVSSELGVAYDLFADLCGHHEPRGLAVRAQGSGAVKPTALTYRELEQQSRAVAAALLRAGLQPGDPVALCHREFADELIARLGALRAGAVLCLVEPRGRAQLRHELALLAPAFVVCCDLTAHWLDGSGPPRVRVEARDGAALPAGASTAHRADAPILRLVSRFDPRRATVVEVTAHRYYLGLLNTALLALDLRRHRSVAFPGADLEAEHVVCAASLLGGAAYTHVRPSALVDDRELLARSAIDVLGASSELRDHVLGGRVRAPKVALWLHDPSAPFDWEPWDRFGQLLAAEGARGASASFALTAGGLLFASPHRKRPHLLEVFPIPGRPYFLGDVLGTGVESEGPSGLYTLAELGAESPCHAGSFLLSRDGARIMLSGSIGGTPHGRPHDLGAVERTAAALPGVRGALALTRPGIGRLNGATLLLIVFLDSLYPPDGAGLLRLEQELTRTLGSELGPDAVPARIVLYPLEPRRAEGRVDARWGESQWTDGLLGRKAGSQVFTGLSRIRRVVSALVDEG
jgi:AMP-binding enzyme